MVRLSGLLPAFSVVTSGASLPVRLAQELPQGASYAARRVVRTHMVERLYDLGPGYAPQSRDEDDDEDEDDCPGRCDSYRPMSR